MSPELIILIVKLEIFYAPIPGLLFVVLYHTRTKGTWNKTAVGRHMMWFMAILEFVFLNSAIAVLWPGMPGRRYLGIVLWALICFIVTWRLILMLRVQGHKDETEHE